MKVHRKYFIILSCIICMLGCKTYPVVPHSLPSLPYERFSFLTGMQAFFIVGLGAKVVIDTIANNAIYYLEGEAKSLVTDKEGLLRIEDEIKIRAQAVSKFIESSFKLLLDRKLEALGWKSEDSRKQFLNAFEAGSKLPLAYNIIESTVQKAWHQIFPKTLDARLALDKPLALLQSSTYHEIKPYDFSPFSDSIGMLFASTAVNVGMRSAELLGQMLKKPITLVSTDLHTVLQKTAQRYIESRTLNELKNSFIALMYSDNTDKLIADKSIIYGAKVEIGRQVVVPIYTKFVNDLSQ